MDPELIRGGQIGAGQIGAERLLDTHRSGAMYTDRLVDYPSHLRGAEHGAA
jgi:hypothetical protein